MVEYHWCKPGSLVLTFAVNVVIYKETFKVQVHALDILSTEFEPLRLKVSWIKNKVLPPLCEKDE